MCVCVIRFGLDFGLELTILMPYSISISVKIIIYI